jgi:hypothetical protein
MKTFRGDLIKLYNHLKKDEPFAFNRFSDGEEFILQNKYLEINDSQVIAGETVFNKGFSKEDHKVFDPEKHQWFRERLLQAFYWEQDRYYKGIPCRCCVGEERFKYLYNLGNSDKNQYITWANLLVNGNYSFFIDTFIPEFAKKDVVIICNHKANIQKLPFKVVKDFRVGDNCMINDYNIIEKIKEFTGQTDGNLLYLFSASALSKVAIHQLFKFNNKGFYMDIGTTLNYYLDMSLDRDYLKNKWLGTNYDMGNRMCIW